MKEWIKFVSFLLGKQTNKPNPFSHTCSRALLSSAEYLNPQSAGVCKFRALLWLFMPNHSSNCCQHSKRTFWTQNVMYTCRIWEPRVHHPEHSQELRNKTKTTVKGSAFEVYAVTDSENIGSSPRSSPDSSVMEPHWALVLSSGKRGADVVISNADRLHQHLTKEPGPVPQGDQL